MNKTIIQQKTEAALNSLDGMQRAVPAPYLLTRINAALARQTPDTIWNRLAAFISRPSVALGVLLLFIVVNGFIIFSNTKNDTATTAVTDFEYSNTLASNYDIENVQP